MESRTGAGPVRACHDVLLAMAGRIPDRTLWRLRDWLAADAGIALRSALPRTLVRHRVGVTEDERGLLRAAVLGWGGSSRLVDAVLHTDGAPAVTSADGAASAFTFVADGPRAGWDAADLVLRAFAPAAGVAELRRTWRRDGRAEGPGGRRGTAPVRVVLARAEHGADPAALTGALQRALRAQGEAEPQVEVLAPDSPATGYHAAAIESSELLWRPTGQATEPPAPRLGRRTDELVGHG